MREERNEVIIDMNHPYAGKTLKFKLIVLEINDEPKYDPSCFDCSCGGNSEECTNNNPS
jgi:FKBP-type peptidyl-prolyl cis-trans isomerase 2